MRITNRIHLLRHDFEINVGQDKKIPRFVNSLIVFGKKITLVDCGTRNSHESIFEYIRQNNREPSEIVTLILSHSHPDHIGSAKIIKDKTRCKIIAHRDEKEWIENIGIQAKNRPVPGFYDLVDQSVEVDEYFRRNQIINLDDNLHLQIIFSPGHSKGSISIQFIDEHVLFTADSIPLKDDIPNYDNYRELRKSLDRIKSIKDYKVFLTSWTPPLKDKSEVMKLINEGESYLDTLDVSVRKNYNGQESSPLEFCAHVIKELNLPEYFINPIVDKAFRTHFKQEYQR